MREELIKNSKFMSMRDEITSHMVESGDNVIRLFWHVQTFNEINELSTHIDFMMLAK